jgi:transposase InsO family protein
MRRLSSAPRYPQTQGKIERWHHTLKSGPSKKFLPGDLYGYIEAFVEHYNHQRRRESLKNGIASDIFFGRAPAIIK